MVVSVTDFLNPLVSLWNSFATVVPGLVVALVLLVVGYLVAYIIGRAVKIVLVKAKVDKKVEEAKINRLNVWALMKKLKLLYLCPSKNTPVNYPSY